MLSGGAERALLEHLWPGNVRELRHCIERAYVLTPTPLLDPHSIFDDASSPERVGVEPATLADYLHECERRYLLQELTRNEWHMGQTAKSIGISRKNLWERLRRLDVHPPGRGLKEAIEADFPSIPGPLE